MPTSLGSENVNESAGQELAVAGDVAPALTGTFTVTVVVVSDGTPQSPVTMQTTPNDVPASIVFSSQAKRLVGNQIVPGRCWANQTGIAMCVWVLDSQRDGVDDLVVSIDFDDPGGAALGDHGQAIQIGRAHV